MSDDLVERLKDEAQRLSGYSLDQGRADAGIAANLADEAASRIEALQQRIDETAARWAKWLNEQEALVEAREKVLCDALAETLEIASRNEAGDYQLRARAALEGQP